VYCNSPEISGRLGDRIFEREERHSDGPLVWQRAEFYGRAFLGPWIRRATVGFELEQVRQYIREQESADGNSGGF
jgi:hypothetical protein